MVKCKSKGKGKVVSEVKRSKNQVHVNRNKDTNCINNALLPNYPHGDKGDLYKELWRACAGPLVHVPRTGERVVYFPQGHMEQVEAFMNQDGKMEMPIYNLPPKIFCKVVNVQLKAEAGTDEVFSQITLLPETKQDMLSLKEDGDSPPLPCKIYPRSFSKKLTSSDTSTHGGFSVLKRHAEECLPPMDLFGDRPEQKLFAKDLHGSGWSFRHVYRGQPKRHLLTTGWSTFVTSKKLLPGDAFIFIGGQNGELGVGVRRAMKLQSSASTTSLISAHSMQHGILATAIHAINTGTMFTVYYRPWTSPSEFIIPFDQYLESSETDYSVSTKFRMLFEGEECAEQRIERFEGTIVGNEDVDPIRWPNSEWRSLKVKWDAASEGFVRPDKVSPWMIEPIERVRKHTSPLHLSKKMRPLDEDSWLPSIVDDGLLHGPFEYATPNHLGVLQGQEKMGTDVDGLAALKPPMLPHLIPIPSLNNKPPGLGNQMCFLAHGPFLPCPSGTILFSGGKITSLGVRNSYCPQLSSYGIPENAIGSRNLSVMNVSSCNSGPQGSRTLEQKDGNEILQAPPSGSGTCRVFGVNLVNNPPELPSPQVATYSDHESLCFVPATSQSSVSEPSKPTSFSNSESQCKNCCSATKLSCTKVLKYGAAGRSIDLKRFNGYNELISELDQMFDFKCRLTDGSSGWQVTYDDEGDVMQIGDCEWKLSVKTDFSVGRKDIPAYSAKNLYLPRGRYWEAESKVTE